MNNGHTIQVDTASGGSLAAGGTSYDLLQFHFHAPSEHLVGGQKFPMEVHFVHRNAAGTLGVLGIFLKEGASNPAFAAIVGAMPKEAEAKAPLPADVDVAAFLPKSLAILELRRLADDAALQRDRRLAGADRAG